MSAAAGLALQGRAAGKRTWPQVATTISTIVIAAVALLGYYATISGSGETSSYLSSSANLLSRSPSQWITQPCLNFLKTGQSLAILFTAQRHAALGLLVAVLWIPTMIGLIQALRRREYLGACITAGYLASVLLKRPLLPRYLLPIAPFLVLYYIHGIQWLIELRISWRPYGRRIALASLCLFAALNAPRTVTSVVRIHSAREGHSDHLLKSRQEAAAFLAGHASDGKKFIGNQDERMLSLPQWHCIDPECP